MNVTISPQIRILAVVGLLAALGLGASMLMLGRGGSTTESVAARTSPTHTPARTHATPPVKPATTPAKTAAKPATKTPTRERTAVHHQVRKTSKAAGFRGNPVYAQLPQALQWELAHHRVVVVSVYNSRSDVDAISVAEAHAGAVDANVGFLLVDVLDNKVAGLLTALLPGGGLLPDPGVLVYRAPGDLALRLDGFADRDSVAQAATNALAGETGPAPASPELAPAVPAATLAPAAATAP